MIKSIIHPGNSQSQFSVSSDAPSGKCTAQEGEGSEIKQRFLRDLTDFGGPCADMSLRFTALPEWLAQIQDQFCSSHFEKGFR